MSQTRREFLVCAGTLASGALAGWAEPPESARTQALRAACGFLAARQSPDGAWRSTSYGAFRDGDALTPLVLLALARTPAANAKIVAHGVRWLEALTVTQSTCAEPWAGLRYPLFTAAYAAQVFAGVGDVRRTAFWADVVMRLRIRAELGWPARDTACGAWSDAPAPPVLPAGVYRLPDMLAPNISATLLALQALAATGRATDAARPFLAQCQNFSIAPATRFDDGGFFFAVGDPVRNKAGRAGCDAAGRERYRSYGSATCDGLLALHACGAGSEAPQIRAAFDWLRLHAAGVRHGGTWPPDRSDERESLRYYHAQAFAAVLALAAALPERKAWAQDQRHALTIDLLATQRSDGAWNGACPDSFEDEPLVATAFAVRALG